MKIVDLSLIHIWDGNYSKIHVSIVNPLSSTILTIIQTTLCIQRQLQWETKVSGSNSPGDGVKKIKNKIGIFQIEGGGFSEESISN